MDTISSSQNLPIQRKVSSHFLNEKNKILLYYLAKYEQHDLYLTKYCICISDNKIIRLLATLLAHLQKPRVDQPMTNLFTLYHTSL